MGSGISDGALPTEYEKIGHKETYLDKGKKIEITVGDIYRLLPDRKDVCSVSLASPNLLSVQFTDGYRPGNSSSAEGTEEILGFAKMLEPVSDEWASDTARMFRSRAEWLEIKVRSKKIAKQSNEI